MSWKNVVFKVHHHHSGGIHFPHQPAVSLLYKTTRKIFDVAWQGQIRWVMSFHQKHYFDNKNLHLSSMMADRSMIFLYKKPKHMFQFLDWRNLYIAIRSFIVISI